MYIYFSLQLHWLKDRAQKKLANDEFSESDSEHSLDHEIGSDSSSKVSYSEPDSDPENDFPGRKISISKQDATTTTRGRHLTLGRGNVTTTSRGRVRTRGGRGVQSLSRGSRARGRSATPRGGTIRRNGQSIDQNDKSNANTTGLPADKEGSNAEESNTSDDNATSKGEEGDNWTKNNPSVQNFVFNEKSGMNTDVPENASPVYFFELLLTEQFIQDLVTKTNEYPEKTINASRPLRRRSNLADWKDVAVDEMRKFIGIVFAMGLASLPSYKKYWSSDPIYKNHFFRNVMSRERFERILRFLHFGDQPKFEDDRLAKIRMILDHLNKVMSEIIIPDKKLSLDESMMLWRGRLMFRQYIKNKRHKYGIRSYEQCTYDGLVLNEEIYGGQAFNEEQNLGQTGATVLKLMKPFLNKGYHVFTDNFYNSVALTEYLSKQKTYTTGTLRRDRKRNPESVISKKLKEGEMVWPSLNDITVCKWKDKREVLTISNAHQAEMVSVSNRSGKEKMKPNIVKDYNEAMSEIDRSDQMLSIILLCAKR